MITYICGTDGIHYKEFPKQFWEDINSLMRSGDEILLGDSDFDHRVYGRLQNHQYENVSVLKSVPPKHRYPLARIKAEIPCVVNMLKKCDRMIAVWDGISEEVFLHTLLLMALKKKCRLYHLPSGKCVEIVSTDDLKPYVTESHGWTNDDVREVFRKCGFSEEMIAYNTQEGEYCENELSEIICKAPVSLKAKYEILEDLRKKNSINYDSFSRVPELIANDTDFELVKQTVCDVIGEFGMCLDDCCAAIRNAEFDLKYNDLVYEKRVYYLFDEWYDPDVFIVKSEPLGVFDSLKNVLKYIKQKDEYENDYYDEDEDPEEDEFPFATWYKLEAWTISDSGSWENYRYDYYFYNGEICWFEHLKLESEKNGYKYYSAIDRNPEFLGGLRDLNMPTPYKPGDIVNIDCRPFGPPFHAMITEAHNQYDCCMPQILFKMAYTDKWGLEALKHKRFYKDAELTSYEPALSPMYRIRLLKEDELKKDDELLIKISKELNGDEEKARAFWKAWNKTPGDEKSGEEVIELWKNLSCKQDCCPLN